MRKILLCLFLSLAFCGFSQDVGRLLWTQQELEREISTSVDNLIAQSRASTEELLTLMERLKDASNEVEELRTLQSDLNISLANTSKSLNESKTQIIRLSQNLRNWKRACMILAGLMLFGIIGTAIVLYLELTGKTNFI